MAVGRGFENVAKALTKEVSGVEIDFTKLIRLVKVLESVAETLEKVVELTRLRT